MNQDAALRELHEVNAEIRRELESLAATQLSAPNLGIAAARPDLGGRT